MASLYELNARILTYEMQFDEDGCWVNEEELDSLNLEREEKLEQLCLWVKNLRAEAEMVKAEAKNLTDRAKKLINKADHLEDYVALNLDGAKLETPRVKILWRKSESVEILDESKIPDEFLDISTVRKPIKAEIKKYLKGIEGSDETCEWARIDAKNNMSIK